MTSSIFNDSSLGFVPVEYDLVLDLHDHSKKNFIGLINITFQKNENFSKINENLKLILNSKDLTILSAVYNDEKATVKYDRDLERVILNFGVPITKITDEEIKVEIKYIAKINKINTYKDPTKGVFITNYLPANSSNTSDHYIVATQSQPCDSRSIFPCIDELNSKAKISLTLKISPKFNAISNAPIINEELENDSSRIISFAKTSPMVISLFAFSFGDFEYLENFITINNTDFPIRVYTLIGNLSKAQYSLDFISYYLPVITKKLGIPYPGEKLDILGIPFLSNGAVENWNLITLQQDILLVEFEEMENLKSKKPSQKIRQLNQILVHELIHQWFGNEISFDSWNSYWLNEALATFLAYCILNDGDFDLYNNFDYNSIWYEQSLLIETVFNNDINSLSISDLSSNVNNINVDSISKTFSQFTYEKGIHLLRMFMNFFNNDFNDKIDFFLQNLGNIVTKYSKKVIKPIDFWLSLADNFNGDEKLTNFIISWIKLPGFPIISVSITDNEEIKVEQHRYLSNEEDYVYQVPLSFVFKDRKFNFLLKERVKIFDKNEISTDEFVCIKSSYFKVNYTNLNFFKTIATNLINFDKITLTRILLDLESYIGTKYESLQIEGFVKILNKISNQKKLIVDYENLEILLRILQYLDFNIQSFRSFEDYVIFKKFLNNFIKKIYSHISSWPLSYSSIDYNKSEITCRNYILMMGLEIAEIKNYCEKLFKVINQGPQKSIPRELIKGILTNYNYNTKNIKNFKKSLQLTNQSSQLIIKNVSNNLENDLENPLSSSEFQGIAVSSIGFVNDLKLFEKILNFVSTNIDLKQIELSLIGFTYGNNKKISENEYKKKLFDWFKLQFYNGWGIKSLREGSDDAKHLFSVVHNIMEIIIKDFTKEEDLLVLRNFFDDLVRKNSIYKLHKFDELLEDTLKSQEIDKTFIQKVNIKLFS